MGGLFALFKQLAGGDYCRAGLIPYIHYPELRAEENVRALLQMVCLKHHLA